MLEKRNLEERSVEVDVLGRIDGNFEERAEDVIQDFLHAVYKSGTFIELVEPGNLNEPANLVAKDFEVLKPFGKGGSFRFVFA